MLKETQLAKMTMKDLLTLQQRVESAIEKRKERDREVVKQKMEKLAQESGYNIVELFGTKPARKRAPVAVKYRDPKNPSNTWTGRGRMPRWLAAKVKAGQKREKFLIKKK